MQTPRFEYSLSKLERRANLLANLELPYDFVPRFAVKANPHPKIIELFSKTGLAFDASSSYEATELLEQGIPGDKISLSSQQPAHNIAFLLSRGVQYVATSLHQLELFVATKDHPISVGLRVNPGQGSGHNNRTTTGGANSSFGLWHTYVPHALELTRKNRVTIDRLHVHIGSGADPSVWQKTIQTALELVEQMPDVSSLDIGGGYKIHRFGIEKETNMSEIINVFSEELKTFYAKTGRKIQLEIEPGTWLVAEAGTLIAEIVDIVDTGEAGYRFLKLNTGMNDMIRPSMYGAQHRMEVLNNSINETEYIVVGHNCETGDILTPASGDSERIELRQLKIAHIGDELAIYDAGAYCASFSVHGYNSFPNAKEVFVE